MRFPFEPVSTPVPRAFETTESVGVARGDGATRATRVDREMFTALRAP